MWTHLGSLAMSEGDYRKAQMCFRTALNKSTSILTVWVNLALALQLADSAGVTIELHIRKMIKQWLGEDDGEDAQPASPAAAPAAALALSPASAPEPASAPTV